ncbi:chemotaxis protein CheW [Variovorax sp. PvP013]|uniref:chemotaxis protein CheW n=1 Tax=Variovorax sp. PvP013 TaxID=3156435 RepID=UPI003D22C44B
MVASDMPRAFQVPPAAPAPAAGLQDASTAWLAVEAGAHHYLLALGDTGEIFPWTAPQPVPHTVGWFLGVSNLRGGLYGVVDLDAFAAADAGPDGARTARRTGDAPTSTRLVALHARFDVNCALQVDRVLGLRGAELFAADASAGAGEASAWRSRHCVDTAGTRWQVLDLQALARHPRFLNVGF